MGVVALIAVLVAGWWVLSDRPHATAVGRPGSTAAVAAVRTPASPVSASPTASSRPCRWSIDVVGRVAAPGIYRLAPGSRIDDAIRAAGGALPGTDLTSLNLASKVSDGQQVAVGIAGAPAPAAGPSGIGAASGPVDLNAATLAQLDALPGVGPVLAQHILDWRTAHGRFASVGSTARGQRDR